MAVQLKIEIKALVFKRSAYLHQQHFAHPGQQLLGLEGLDHPTTFKDKEL